MRVKTVYPTVYNLHKSKTMWLCLFSFSISKNNAKAGFALLICFNKNVAQTTVSTLEAQAGQMVSGSEEANG
jgi:hypothetical protein